MTHVVVLHTTGGITVRVHDPIHGSVAVAHHNCLVVAMAFTVRGSPIYLSPEI